MFIPQRRVVHGACGGLCCIRKRMLRRRHEVQVMERDNEEIVLTSTGRRHAAPADRSAW